MGKFRDGLAVNAEAVTQILATIDRIKLILESIARNQCEPDGNDTDLIANLDRITGALETAGVGPHFTVGTLVPQMLERPLRPGEVSLDDLERAFRATPAEPAARE